MKVKIVWHGEPCPQEYLAQVEAELSRMLGGMLDSPAQLISHRIFLGNGSGVTAWGESGDDAFHAEYEDTPTNRRADEALRDRMGEVDEELTKRNKG